MATAQSNILLESGTNEVEVLELFIDEEDYKGFYGVNVAKVLEIIPLPAKITRPPNRKAAYVAGMFNHRDKIVPLIDLAGWLGKSRVERTAPKVLITQFNGVTTAFLVSGVTRIHRATWRDIRPLEGYMEGLSNTVTSVIELGDKPVFLLDLEKVIADLNPELAIADSSARSLKETTGGAYEPIKVLHADDSVVIRHTVKRHLEEQGIFSVQSVTNGNEAWQYMAELNERCAASGRPLTDFVDVLLTDIEMPGMDGYHLCKKVKEHQTLKSIPVVVFSSLITDNLLHKGEAVGADGQFAKPDLELMRFIKELVDKKRRAD